MSQWTLYHYWRSSSSWRVRWALNLKKAKANLVPVDLLNGESESAAHVARHPLGYVPVLEIDSTRRLLESVAIIEWLEENIPSPQLYPGDTFMRARIRMLCELINADTQPIQNITVAETHSSDANERKLWMQHFIRRGLAAYQTMAQGTAGAFSVGSQVTAADLFLIPQFYNALRFEIDASEFPLLKRIYEAALQTPECQASHPDRYKP